VNRRDLLRTVGAAVAAGTTAATTATARQFPEGYDASKELAGKDWKPIFFDDHQNETLIALSELIVPGAKEALVNRFVDGILAVETREAQGDFLNALAFLDGECRDRYHAPFLDAAHDQQIGLLTSLAHPAHRHFLTLKDWISRAYYSSENGQRELGSDGTPPHGVFSGCGH